MTFAAALGACSSTIHDEARIGGYDTLSIDAKQRLVLFGTNPYSQTPMVCAEPSPDAIVAASAAFAASGSATLPAAQGESGQQQFGGGGGFASSESAASIAMRTATVQVLRDGYYRLCEGMLNGSISPQAYARVIRGIGDFIATTMAVDAAGGMKHAPAVAINGGTVSASADASSENTTATGATGTAEGNQTPTGILIGSITPGQPTKEQAEAISRIIDAYLSHVERYY
jgi:hypothetical protein